MSLTYRERPAAGVPAGLLILHHGRGADEHDLLGLADVLDPQRKLHVVTPRGPLTVPGWPGYHWYTVPRVGYPDYDTFHATYRKLAAFHDETWQRTGIDPGADRARGVLDGVGDELLAGARRRPARGRRDCWCSPGSSRPLRAGQPDLASREHLPVFIAHGRRDPIMDVGFARRARELLDTAGLPVTYLESDAAHHIDPAHIPAATRWLAALTDQSRSAAIATSNPSGL